MMKIKLELNINNAKKVSHEVSTDQNIGKQHKIQNAGSTSTTSI